MAKERVYITAMKNGVPVGYIKSVSVAKGTFTLTPNKVEAKGYATYDAVQGDIDKLIAIAFNKGYIFIYN